jgi:type IV pilus assembly protein PilC
MSKYSQIFSPVFLAMIQAGERGGKLDKVLEELARDTEKEAEISATVKGSLLYPIIIVFFLLLSAAFLTVWIAPQIEQLFVLSKVAVPNTTRFILDASAFFSGYWPSVTIILMLIVLMFYVLFKTKAGKKIGDRIALSFPVMRKISRSVNMERFTRTLSILLSSGIGIIDALNLSALASKNLVISSAIRATGAEVERGTPISQSIKMQKIFPDTVFEMVSVGEETGRVDSVLASLAEMYRREVDDSIKGLIAVIEPVLLIVLGAGIGFFIFSVLLPLYNVSRV